jgi:hypothetical protein
MTAQHDLTMRMIPFLDRHLVYPLIKFVDLNEVSCSITFLSATPEPLIRPHLPPASRFVDLPCRRPGKGIVRALWKLEHGGFHFGTSPKD